MKVALDMDEVLCSLISPILNNKKISLKYEEITNYNLWEIMNLTKNEAIKLFIDLISEDFSKNHKILTPLDYTVDTIKKIKERADKVYIVTARPELLKDQTYSWVNKYLPNLVDDIVFTNKSVDLQFWNKANILKYLGINLFVDDNLDNARWAMNIGVEKVFLPNKPWNQGENFENIVRINSFNEILDYID